MVCGIGRIDSVFRHQLVKRSAARFAFITAATQPHEGQPVVSGMFWSSQIPCESRTFYCGASLLSKRKLNATYSSLHVAIAAQSKTSSTHFSEFIRQTEVLSDRTRWKPFPESADDLRRFVIAVRYGGSHQSGGCPPASYSLRTVSPESDTTSESLSPVLPNQPDSGTFSTGRKTCPDRYQCEYTCGARRHIVRRVGRCDGSSFIKCHQPISKCLPCGLLLARLKKSAVGISEDRKAKCRNKPKIAPPHAMGRTKREFGKKNSKTVSSLSGVAAEFFLDPHVQADHHRQLLQPRYPHLLGSGQEHLANSCH